MPSSETAPTVDTPSVAATCRKGRRSCSYSASHDQPTETAPPVPTSPLMPPSGRALPSKMPPRVSWKLWRGERCHESVANAVSSCRSTSWSPSPSRGENFSRVEKPPNDAEAW
jgi:hypothetical protein